MTTDLTTNLKGRKPVDVTVGKINDIIQWYKDNYKKASLEDYMNAKSLLETSCWDLASFVGETKDAQLTTESDRKLKHHLKRKEFIEGDYSIARAEDEAILATETEKRRADSFESYYATLRLMLDAAWRVGDTLTQRIAISRQELKSVQ